MGERDGRVGRNRLHDLFEKARQIVVIFGEVANVHFQRIGEQTCAAALAAPVEGRDREAASAQLADHLDIFFDELGLAAEHNADAARRRSVEHGGAQARAVFGEDVMRREWWHRE
jgi:hypothetical protein